MAAFEVRRDEHGRERPGERPGEPPAAGEGHGKKRPKEERIIAFKIYDSCRNQDCLTHADIGPARAAEAVTVGGVTYQEGDVIKPPESAASVTVDNLQVLRGIIVNKQPNPFKRGYWDIDLKYVFSYGISFREADGGAIGTVNANSIFNKRVTLFGSVGEELVIATDLFADPIEITALGAEPFIMTEAKAVALMAKLYYQNGAGDAGQAANEVHVTIGLFTIARLYRIVDLEVLSNGFGIPPECEECSPVNPCEFFERLDFPMDIFAPPQKDEFAAGASGNIPFPGDKKE